MFDVIGKRRWYFLISLCLTIPGFLLILATPLVEGAGLRFSLDYTGGTKWVIQFEDPSITSEQVREVVVREGFEDSSVISTGSGYFEIKTKELDLRTPDATPTPSPTAEPSADPSASPGATESPEPTSAIGPVPGDNTQIPTDGPLGALAAALQTEFGPIADQQNLTSIGAVVTADLINQAIILILVGSVGIMIWITFRFRDKKFGLTALIALVHDVIVVVGAFAVLGTFFNVEIDGLFVTAMLTVIGYSVHDTIVVFDRIRENTARHVGEPFPEIVNHSVLQTFGRSLTTSITVVVTLAALLLFGGAATTYFVLALLLGIAVGTYSSIFVAAPLLVVWQEWEDRRKGRLAARRPRRVTA